MRTFRNKQTGKIIKLDENSDRHLINDLERDPDYKELFYT